MKLESVFDPAFRAYGSVLEGYELGELSAAMARIPLPETGTAYRPAIESLEACRVFGDFAARAYGGMPIQLGMCWGRNTKLNCLEYHRSSEINLGTGDFVLLLARREEMEHWMLDTAKVRAFRVPAGVPVELFATTLHFAPCHLDEAEGFRVAVVLPRGTNTELPVFTPRCQEDRMMTARNKWLLAHPESRQARNGARIGLTGPNLDLAAEGEAAR